MKKTIAIIPIMTAFMALGALALAPSKTEKVQAIGEPVLADGAYFIVNYDKTYGLLPSATVATATSIAAHDSLTTPLQFTKLEADDTYSISYTNNTTAYFANKSGSNTRWDSTSEHSTWKVTDNLDGTYAIESTDEYSYKYLNYYDNGAASAFRCSSSNGSGNSYKIRLYSVQESIDSLVTAIRNVNCSTKNPTIDDWKKIGTAYNAIPRPVLNYLDLENAPADKDALDTTLEWAMAKYDYVCGKYHESKGFEDYLNREPSYPTDGVNNFTTTKVESSNLTIIVTVVSLITIASVTSLLFLKKKKKVIVYNKKANR